MTHSRLSYYHFRYSHSLTYHFSCFPLTHYMVGQNPNSGQRWLSPTVLLHLCVNRGLRKTSKHANYCLASCSGSLQSLSRSQLLQTFSSSLQTPHLLPHHRSQLKSWLPASLEETEALRREVPGTPNPIHCDAALGRGGLTLPMGRSRERLLEA